MRARLVNEKFIADSDPIQDIRIGLRHQIEKWLEKNIEKYDERKERFIINSDYTIDVNGNLAIVRNSLTKLPDFIKFNKVLGVCWFNHNPNLVSLKGGPKYVEEWFCCNDNKLKSLRYAPKYVGDDFFCHDNAKQFTIEDVKKVCKVTKRIVVK